MRKKRIISFVLIIALLTVLIPVGVIGTTAYADSVKLSPYQSPYATARATDIAQIRKVSQLSKAQSGEDVAKKINDILFNATYRPSDIGGRDWVKDNRGITGIKSVYDDGPERWSTGTGSHGAVFHTPAMFRSTSEEAEALLFPPAIIQFPR